MSSAHDPSPRESRASTLRAARIVTGVACAFSLRCAAPAGLDAGGGVGQAEPPPPGTATPPATEPPGPRRADAGRDAPDAPVVRPIAGVIVGTLAGSAEAGSVDGVGASARFDNPVGVLVGPSGALLVTEYDGRRVRRVAIEGTTSTLATGLGDAFGLVRTADAIFVQTDRAAAGTKDATSGTIWRLGLDGASPEPVVTGLGRPRGLVERADGKIVVSDRMRHVVMLLDPITQAIETLAGSGTAGLRDGRGEAAQLAEPYGLTVLPDGDVVVADRANHCLRRITAGGVVTVFAGEGTRGMKDDDDRWRARFDSPIDVAADVHGNVFVSDSGNHRIRRIAAGGGVQTVAGDGTAGFADGDGRGARFFGQEQLAVTADGAVVYVADGSRGEVAPFHRIRRITLP